MNDRPNAVASDLPTAPAVRSHADDPAPGRQPPEHGGDAKSGGRAADVVAPRLSLDHTSRLTYASLQNAVPLLRAVVIEAGSGGLPGGTLRLDVHPAFARPREWTFAALKPNETLTLPNRDVTLDGAFLDGLDEAERGVIRLEATFASGRDPLAAEGAVDLLARDEWGGFAEMGQLLAAFVQPGDRHVAQVLKRASAILEEGRLPGGLEGYQSGDAARVWSLAAAIWSAVEGLKLTYALPPASFERSGQKVRTPSRIVAEELATCLDTTLLLLACFEAAGLNGAAVFTQGHAFAGVWLVERTLPEPEVRDVTELRKAIVAREFVPMETTLLTGGRAGRFRTAIAQGTAQLEEAREHEFEMAVDIARCRSAGIRPLARLSSRDPAEEAPAGEVKVVAPTPGEAVRPPEDFTPPETPEEAAPATPEGRIDRWQRKLLDLTLRNRLLNFKDTKQSVPLRCDDVGKLEDELTEGRAFRIISLPDENPRGGRDPEQYLRETGEDIDARTVRDALARGELCSPVPGAEMRARLTALYRKAKSDLAEGGTNTLFLAIGFLRWKQSERETRVLRAPLLLVPVTLQRASAASPFRLVHQGDEVRFNLTLLEKLAEQGITANDLKGELPRDDAGLDIARIFRRVREIVRDVPGFEVIDEAALSTFSFSKYLMWKDLVERTDQLRANRLVAHLIDTPETPFVGVGDPGLPRPDEVERRLPPAETFTPLPADASQLAAVAGAAEGRDMIVIGPPGTGKSQTIANLIAHCLAHGKTVLFVAEKAAALDVVHRRLTAYGLGDAVLELHSNKADKKGVIAQLGRAWEREADDEGAARWERLSDDLGLERDRLNDYVTALHARHPNGLSVFEAVGLTVGSASGVRSSDPLRLRWDNNNAHDAASLDALRRLAGDLGETAPRVRDPGALRLIEPPSEGWSNTWVSSLRTALDDLGAVLPEYLEARRRFADAVGQGPAGDPGALPGLAAAGLGELEGDRSALGALDPGEVHKAVRSLIADQASLDEAERRLTVSYAARDLPKVPVDRLDADLRRANASFWPLSMIRRAAVRRELATYASGRPDPAVDLPFLEDMQERLAALDAGPLSVVPDWKGRGTDAAALQRAAERVAEVRAAAIEAGVADGAFDAPTRRLASALSDAHSGFAARLAAFAVIAGREPDMDAADLAKALSDLRGQLARLQDWLLWRGLVRQAEVRGLAPLAAALDAGFIDGSEAEAAFLKAYGDWWVPLAIDATEPLRAFIGWQHQKRIEAFRDLDARHQEMAADRVRHRIAHGLPAPTGVPANSSLGRLRSLMGQSRPRASIRAVLEGLGPAVTQLTPCVLMSPLSIAQYLPAGQATFDLVLFDEASQITTWDAIGAIARGTQSIIVGDPKQMPPSRGFDRVQEDDEDALALHERDQASILDEAVAAGVPQNVLRVHYRSRDEGLIAFSNHRYYDGRLVTFPAPRDWGQAVQLHKVDGTYERGASRTNPDEARAVSSFVVHRLRDWLELDEADRPTLGVVTFNIQQQQRILDHLDAARGDDDRLEWFFSEDREELVIVKNLENIQGDERDVMVFSTTFGRDAAGKLSMNFGPMNQDGGQKRLNVAVTRARREMHVFSSIDASDIDVSRTKAQGVRDLRDFLDYAARGPEALASADTGSMGGVDSPFEADVKAAFEALGWEVRTQIGVSGYRIDLGIVHPDHAGRYLAGIECDGASYHSSPTARDRDRMREAVLRGLGWEIERIWSTEWFSHKARVVDALDARLRELLAASRQTDDAARHAAAESAPIIGEDDGTGGIPQTRGDATTGMAGPDVV